jgi:phosphoglycerol transferase MdoB-like AlkP superfamily enzyme
MNKLLKKFPAPVQFIVMCWLTGMAIFSAFRIVFFILNYGEAASLPTGRPGIPAFVILQSFFMGLRFDAVINGYFLALPAIIYFILSFFKNGIYTAAKIISVFIVMIYGIAFLVYATDFRWYEHGASRLTVAVLQWTDTPGWMLKFLFQDVYNYPFLLMLVLLWFFFYKWIKKIRIYCFGEQYINVPAVKNIPVYLIMLALIFIGIRGRLAIKSPIRWGTAFFSPYNFTNQLGLNPVYTFIRSWLDQKESVEQRYNFMSDGEAEKIIKQELNLAENASPGSPVSREIKAVGNPKRYHVILVLMESMTAKNMTHFGNSYNLTPVLDSLFDRSISFSNFYSDGNHTFNGIFTSLYGFHSLPMVHHMKDLSHQQPFSGLPVTLRTSGYRTLFFTTHDDQFDNMAGFLLPNGIERIISEKDYDRKDVLSTLGVPDHIMFEKVITEMDGLVKNGKPVFISMITGSNHEPFVIPEKISFKPHGETLAMNMVEYADWSIGKFMAEASTHPWFDSTIFIFTGDHGGLVKNIDRYLAFHQVPLIIYAPGIFSESSVNSNVGGQADIFPTVCGILNLNCTVNSMGIDLLNSARRYYPFNFDEEMCAVSDENFFTIVHEQNRFYKLSADKNSMSVAELNSRADSMKTFLEAVMQTTQRMIEERKMK